MQNAFFTFVIGCLTLVLLTACGGGGGGGGGGAGGGGGGGGNPPPADPFGLTQRASLASFNIPQGGGATGTFSLENAYPGINLVNPIYLQGIPGENRVAVLERAGRLVAFTDSRSANDLTEVMDITSRVITDVEHGLLGLAFDPNFVSNRYFYVHYSTEESGQEKSVIARFTWDATSDSANLSTEKIILELDQPFPNHNGGMIAFGPLDNFLYVAFGDGGGDRSVNGQDLSTLHGSVLRLDVHPPNPNDPYAIPLDNPYVNDPAARDEIWAHGFRNPWRFSFDRQTGELWLGDVGQASREEIDIVTAGGNYGWRVFEGTLEFNRDGNTLPDSAFTPPIYEYDHSIGLAITGGYVYRGTQIASLVGKYIYSDSTAANMWALTYDGQQASNETLTGQVGVRQIVSLGETNSGELRAVSILDGIWELNESGGGGQIPDLLSQTGLFTNLANLTPASGLIEYTPNHPFWSDHTTKRRWIGIPDASRVDFSSDDWSFPLGTVTVKHFEIALDENTPAQTTRLETRVLVNTTNGWQGFTYRWNDSGSDANLLTGRESTILDVTLASGGTRTQTYDFPSRTDCTACHTPQAGFVLGIKTPQLNGDFDYSGVVDNQLRSWNNIELFDRDIGDADTYDAYPAVEDAAASVTSRARAYLEVNCSQCHQPGTTTPTDLDLRAATAAGAMNAIDVTPSAGDLGVANARIVAAGAKERSVLWLRMQALDAERMPPLSTHVVDDAGVELIGNWIDSL